MKVPRKDTDPGTLYAMFVADLSTRRKMTTKKKPYLRAPVKTPGGKHYLAKWIITHFPENYIDLRYCEPFCAGASVFLNKKRSIEETISDIDKGVICIFKALRDEPREFIGRIKRIKFTENTFVRAHRRNQAHTNDYIDQAINEFVLRRMSRGGLKKSFSKAEENAWNTTCEHLPLLSKRIRKTNIVCGCFKDVFKVWDEEDTFSYLDPPTLPDPNLPSSYEHEISTDDHVVMLNLAKTARGKVAISGHPSPLYNRHLTGWKCVKTNHASSKKVEMLWMNY